MALLQEQGFLPLNGRNEFNVLKRFLEKEEFTNEYLQEEIELAQRYLTAQLKFLLPVVITALYAFLTIRFEDTSILDFIKYACAFFITKQQTYEWGYGNQ